jgi:hypothetical protein
VADEPITVVLGNRDAVVVERDAKGNETTTALGKGKRATEVVAPEGWTPLDVLRNLFNPGGVWAYHAAEGAVPAWVASNDPGTAQLVAAQFGGIEIRELEPVQVTVDMDGKKIKPAPVEGN